MTRDRRWIHLAFFAAAAALVLLFFCGPAFAQPATAPADSPPGGIIHDEPISPGWIAPFVFLLGAIALMPYIHRHWWEHNYPWVAFGLGVGGEHLGVVTAAVLFGLFITVGVAAMAVFIPSFRKL